MPARTPGANSPSSSLELFDLNLPIPDEKLPRYHDLPIDWVFARNEQIMSETRYDEAYYSASLARKIREPFVL